MRVGLAKDGFARINLQMGLAKDGFARINLLAELGKSMSRARRVLPSLSPSGSLPTGEGGGRG